MPKIATYEPNQVQTKLAGGPRATASSLNFQGLAQGMSNLGNAVVDMKKRIDTTTAEEALNKFEKAKNDVLFNPDTGYYNSQGRDAYDKAQDANQALEKLKNQFSDGLTGDARLMFTGVADKHLIRSGVDIAKHSANGLKAWEVATIEAQVENTMENAALYWNNSKDLKVQRILGEQAIHESAKLMGIGAEATNEKLQTYRSKFMVNAVDAAIVKSADAGQNLLDENKNLFEPQDKVKLQKAIDTKKKAETTQFNAGQATLTATRLVDDYDSRGDIQAEVNKIKDPELKKKTMTEAMALYSRKRQIESEERGDTFEEVEKSIMQGGTAVQYMVSNPEGWEKLSPAQQKHFTSDRNVEFETNWNTYSDLISMSEKKNSLRLTLLTILINSVIVKKSIINAVKKANADDKKADIETNWNTYSNLMTMPKEELINIDPVNYFDQLAESERKTLINAVKTVRAGNVKGVDETNWNTYSDLMTLPKGSLAMIDPVDYFDQLGKAERKSLISAVKTAKGAGSKTEKDDSQVGRTRASEVKSAVTQIFGYKTEDKKSDEDRKNVDSFYSLLNSEVDYREGVKGSKLTSAEFTDVLAGFTRKAVQEKSTFFWMGVPFDSVAGIPFRKKETEVGIDEIPTEDIPGLSEHLRSKNIPVNTDNLLKLYNQVKGK